MSRRLRSLWLAVRDDDRDWWIGDGTRAGAVENARQLSPRDYANPAGHRWRAVRFVPAQQASEAKK